MQIPEFARMQLDDEREALKELKAFIKSERHLQVIDLYLHGLRDVESSYAELDAEAYTQRLKACVLLLCAQLRDEVDVMILRYGPNPVEGGA